MGVAEAAVGIHLAARDETRWAIARVASGGKEAGTTVIRRIPSTDTESSVGRFEDARALPVTVHLTACLRKGIQERGGSRHLKRGGCMDCRLY